MQNTRSVDGLESSAARDRIPPVRGLITVRNQKGARIAPIDLKRWIRLSRAAYKTPKIDVLFHGFDLPLFRELTESADETDTRLSIRTNCAAPPPKPQDLKDANPFDVFLTPVDAGGDASNAWLDACRECGLPVRVQLTPPFAEEFDSAVYAQKLAQAGVTAVNLRLTDPFSGPSRGAGKTLQQLFELATALAATPIELNVLGVPFCLLDESLWPNAINTPQFFLDHQQYRKRAYELASLLYHRSPVIVNKLLTILLARHTLHRSAIDTKLLPWLVNRPWIYARLIAARKLTRHLRLPGGAPKALPNEDLLGVEGLIDLDGAGPASPDPVCAECSLRRICDGMTPELRRILPDVKPTAQHGDTIVSPLHFCAMQRKHYDAIDVERGAFSEAHLALAKKANDITNNRLPSRRITPYEYGTDDTVFSQFEGAVQWRSLSNTEKLSWPLARLTPPCTVSVTFGGGIADYIGFSFGRHCKVVCPMEAYRHTLTLHVEPDGHYVFLRDAKPIRPTEFEGMHFAPVRLPTNLELKLSIWNIETIILSQFIDIWTEETPAGAVRPDPKYSVIVVSTRYARRLQAVLQSLAHQQNFDFTKLEVIVAYVPGLDPTDDLIDSIQMTYPQLQIRRSPFPEHYAKSKGFVINETVKMALGKWTVLVDSDMVLPPNMFSEIEEVEDYSHFIAADGRKMLSPESTAKILLGELKPWRDWDELMRDSGEFRHREAHGIPVGFFQCVRASCWEKVQYEELDHFEGSDMRFGINIIDKFGPPTRLTDIALIHLDHGGSQWYGTVKHR
ncbi:MAG: glycosyltransferase family 2 protein [Candidatus Hydrogenedentes bacterium]|nr:glycosyltransferase family 2 protein [Candidatus Hydrogenedentota bacterium]